MLILQAIGASLVALGAASLATSVVIAVNLRRLRLDVDGLPAGRRPLPPPPCVFDTGDDTGDFLDGIYGDAGDDGGLEVGAARR